MMVAFLFGKVAEHASVARRLAFERAGQIGRHDSWFRISTAVRVRWMPALFQIFQPQDPQHVSRTGAGSWSARPSRIRRHPVSASSKLFHEGGRRSTGLRPIADVDGQDESRTASRSIFSADRVAALGRDG